MKFYEGFLTYLIAGYSVGYAGRREHEYTRPLLRQNMGEQSKTFLFLLFETF